MRDVHLTRSHRDFKAPNIMLSGWDQDDALRFAIIDFASSLRHEGMLLPCCLRCDVTLGGRKHPLGEVEAQQLDHPRIPEQHPIYDIHSVT